jgi:drug/metabolite transporter (DMT)-like permease
MIGLGCAAICVAVWTTFLLLSRHGAKGTLLPTDMAALRFGVAGLVTLPIVARHGLGGLSLRQALALTLTAGPLFSLFAYTGFSLAPASHAGALMPGLLPFWTILLGWLIFAERPDRGRLVCLAFILGGVASLALSTLREAPPGAWRGDLIYPLAPLAWAVYTILARRWRVAALRTTAAISVLSMVLYLPAYLLFLPKGIGQTPLPELLIQGFFQGVIAVVVALVAFTRAVAALGPAVTTMLTAAVPGLAALLAVPLLGEPITPFAGLGLALVTAGMAATVLGLRTAR